MITTEYQTLGFCVRAVANPIGVWRPMMEDQ